MQEISAPLKLTVKVTVPMICNVSSNCGIIVRIAQANSEVYLSLCSLRLTNESTSQAFEIAVKRDFIYGRNKQTSIKLEVESFNDPVDFINHHKIPEVIVSTD